MRSSFYFKTISRILILAMLHLCWLTSYGYAEIVPTESAVQSQTDTQTDRQRILDLLNRQEVIDELEKYGISKVEATVRINSLNDEEITVIAGKLDKLPEGGDPVYLFIAILPAILSGVFYVAFLPFAAVACIFAEYPWSWSDCMGDYWEFYAKPLREIYGISKAEVPLKNECIDKCTNQWINCMKSSGYDEFSLPLDHQCNKNNSKCIKSCLIEEKKKEQKEESNRVPMDRDCDPGMELCD